MALSLSLRSDTAAALAVVAIFLPWIAPIPAGPSPMAGSIVVAALCLPFALLAWSFLDAGHRAASLCVAVALAGAVSALIGWLQYLGLAPLLGTAWVSPGPGPGVAYANLRQPNQFATLLVMAWVACMALVAAADRPPAVLAGVVTALLATGNAASGSRTGALLWLLAGAAWWAAARQGVPRTRARRAVLWGWLAYAAGVVMLTLIEPAGRSLLQRLTQEDVDCHSRLVLWSNVLQLIAERPWLGWGWGELDYAHYVSHYPGTRFCALLDNAHNLPLQLAIEIGVPAAVLACLLMVGWVWRRSPWRERKPQHLAIWLMLGAMAVHSLLEYPLWYGPFQLCALMSVLVLWRRSSCGLQTAPGANNVDAGARRVVLRVAATLCMGLALKLASDYRHVSQLYLPPAQRSAEASADPWPAARGAWLFSDHVLFAQLMTTPLNEATAEQVAAMALRLLHFSPEPAVVHALIDSLRLLGREDEADWHAARLADIEAATPAQ